MKYILKKYPNVRFVLYYGGEIPRKFHMRWVILKDFRYWTSIKEYPQRLKSMKFDIGLAPLRDRQFNRCKSNLKYLEYSALRIPTVASYVEPYKDTRSLFARSESEWIAQIEKLIKFDELRFQLGEASYNHVREEFNIEKIGKKYNKMIRGLLREPVS